MIVESALLVAQELGGSPYEGARRTFATYWSLRKIKNLTELFNFCTIAPFNSILIDEREYAESARRGDFFFTLTTLLRRHRRIYAA